MISCCVPTCNAKRGLRKADKGVMPSEWICSRHWAGVPKVRKAEKAAAERRVRKALGLARGQAELDACDAWVRCKSAAMDSAAGIA